MNKKERIDQAFHELNAYMKHLMEQDIERFCEFAGIDKDQVVLCYHRAKGLSWQQLSIKTGLAMSTIRDKCAKCPQPK